MTKQPNYNKTKPCPLTTSYKPVCAACPFWKKPCDYPYLNGLSLEEIRKITREGLDIMHFE